MRGTHTSSRRGFTLLELLTAIAVMAVLVALAVPNYIDAKNKARRAEAPPNVQGILDAMTAYRVVNDEGVAPPSSGGAAWNPAEGTNDLSSKQRPWATGETSWDTLGYKPDGEVRCNYCMVDGTWQGPEVEDWYFVCSYCDVDSDGYYFGYWTFSPKAYDALLGAGLIDGDPYLYNPEYY